MSDPNPAAPGVRARPSTVTISSYLLYLIAALQIVSLIMALAVMGPMREAYDDALDGTDMEGTGAIVTIILIVTAIFGLVVAAGLVVLAVLNNRGKNPARIVTWVLGGIYLCCSGGGLALGAAGNALPTTTTTSPDGPDLEQVERDVQAALPGWYEPLNNLISVVALLALLAALILLALPPSNEFFRKPAVAWEPPVPGSGYPGYPPVPGGSYPAAPGTPPATGPGTQPGADPWAPPPSGGSGTDDRDKPGPGTPPPPSV
ncbi:hypothetical protein O7632_02090 [Solwaraspora sp. WMMD406]|uniref:hypothetical protein n=1 Tax=Solwaraspora sp. WMMD406 TaxID=3016095 RepID=UPI002416BD7F|nr:hypothetical protein [Solwaraspora sp. WMMD406]MDG4762910.1 hypothetical protein [Solwaraspora sp. WMMD406]